jgi:hypothetical protein
VGRKNVAPCATAGSEAGFSLIEGLIGAGLLLIVLIGILPLFTRAIIDNTAGADYTRAAQYAKSRVEDFAKSRITSATYGVAPGTTQTVIDEYLVPGTPNTWAPVGGPLPRLAEWERTSTVQGYYYTVPFSVGTPLDGGASPPADFWQIQVVVKNLQAGNGLAGPLLGRHGTTVTYLRSF